MKPKKYPCKCFKCLKIEVRPSIIHQQIHKNHNGIIYNLDIPDLPVVRCSSCGEVYHISSADDRIEAALTEHLANLDRNV